MAKQGNESLDLLHKFRSEKCSGGIVKRFKEEYIVFDLLKILYDDAVDSNVKTELLIDLEEYGHLSLTSESVDQVVTSLLDMVNQHEDDQSNWTFVCQSLICSTSLIIQLDQLETEICKQMVKTLVSIVTNINQSENQRVRSCACHCLIHLEEFQPGLLFSHHDEFLRLARQERTCVYQDYALLAGKVLENIGRLAMAKSHSPLNTDKEKNSSKQLQIQKQLSHDSQDIRQFVAFLIENIGLMTRCGYFRVIQSVAKIVKFTPDISPMVFKPLMLHQMSTVSCVLFQTVMYLQREFQGEIMTEKEQAEFLHRLCLMTDHPCLTRLNKLLVSHWARFYYLDDSDAGDSYRNIIQRLRFRFYPSVFDPVDCQLSKLIMTSLCVNPDDDEGLETSVLLGSLAYIHKLAWHTGSAVVAIVLFKALFYMYQSRNNDSFASDIQRFLRGLCTDLPHFIPHTIDFLDSIQELQLNSTIYVETLDLLHKQVVMATDDQIEKSYYFYLQILKKAACENEISQSSSLQFLQNLAERAQYLPDGGWSLGHSILEICRNFLMYLGTDLYYTGSLRSFVDDTDDYDVDFPEDYYYQDDEESELPETDTKVIIWNITFWEVVSVATCLMSLFLLVFVFLKIYLKKLLHKEYRFIYVIYSLIGCLLSSIVVITEVVVNSFGQPGTTKSGQLCLYIHVVNTTLVDWIGVCLILASIDMLCCGFRSNDSAGNQFRAPRLFANMATILLAVLLFVINSIPYHHLNDLPVMVNSCSKDDTFVNNKNMAARFELGMKLIVVSVLIISMISVFSLVNKKLICKTEEKPSSGQIDLNQKIGDLFLNRIVDDLSGCECHSIGLDTTYRENREEKGSNAGKLSGSHGNTDNRKVSFPNPFRSKRLMRKNDEEGNSEFVDDKKEDTSSRAGYSVTSSSHGSLTSRSLAQRRYSHSCTMETIVSTTDSFEKGLSVFNSSPPADDLQHLEADDFLKTFWPKEKLLIMSNNYFSFGQNVFIDIGELLYYMMVHYIDVDVQDKARFYYSLLTGASDSKIQSVLKTMVYDASSVNQTISALLPGSTQGKRLSKITRLEDNIFTWERISVTMQTSGQKKTDFKLNDSSSDTEVIQEYRTFLNDLDVVVNIKCRLTLTNQSKWSRVHALCVKTSPTQHCGQIPDNHVAVLKVKDHTDIMVKVQPFLPVPQTFNSSVTFTCSSKETFDVNLPVFNLDFYHLMMPLQFKPDNLNTSEFFHDLWKWLAQGANYDRSGVESLKLFDVSLAEFSVKYSDKLGKFQLKDENTSNKENLYLIFMPPKYHVLLHCKEQEDKVVVAMVMDDWSLLPHVDKFLMEK